MHAVYAAANSVLTQSFDMFDEALEGLPDSAVQWTPASGMSSLAVLVTHSISSTRFNLGAAVGDAVSREQYLAEDRPKSFRTQTSAMAELRQALKDARSEFESTLSRGTEDTLLAPIHWADAEQPLSGAECLIRAIAHLREHVGHAQVMRDLWLTASREGR